MSTGGRGTEQLRLPEHSNIPAIAAIAAKSKPTTIMDLPTSFTLNNGYKVPSVGLGTFQGDDGNGKVKEAVKLALQLGYRHIDGASAYGNERKIGEAIKESNVPREEIFVTSKL